MESMIIGRVARAVLCLSLVQSTFGIHTYGTINLDNVTFPKVVDGSRPVLVRFDREFAYGEKADAFRDVASELATDHSDLDLFVGTVGMTPAAYGAKAAKAADGADGADYINGLAELFGFKEKGKVLEYNDFDKSFPGLVFFPKGVAAAEPHRAIRYDGDVTKDALLGWIKLMVRPPKLNQLSETAELNEFASGDGVQLVALFGREPQSSPMYVPFAIVASEMEGSTLKYTTDMGTVKRSKAAFAVAPLAETGMFPENWKVSELPTVLMFRSGERKECKFRGADFREATFRRWIKKMLT